VLGSAAVHQDERCDAGVIRVLESRRPCNRPSIRAIRVIRTKNFLYLGYSDCVCSSAPVGALGAADRQNAGAVISEKQGADPEFRLMPGGCPEFFVCRTTPYEYLARISRMTRFKRFFGDWGKNQSPKGLRPAGLGHAVAPAECLDRRRCTKT